MSLNFSLQVNRERQGMAFAEILGNKFSLALPWDLKNEEKGYIDNKNMAKEENKWSGLRSRRKTINIMLYDIILQSRELVEVVK